MATTTAASPSGAERRDERLAQALVPLQFRGQRVRAGAMIMVTEQEFRRTQMAWVTESEPALDAASLKSKRPVLPPQGVLPSPSTLRQQAQARVNELLLEAREAAPSKPVFREARPPREGVGHVERGG